MKLPIDRSIKPMLSKLRSDIPRDPGWIYEPKWDGFRALVFFDGTAVDVLSRDSRPLLRYFPELDGLIRKSLERPGVVDGEIVVTTLGGLDFDALQLRIHPASSRVAMLSESTPASFIAFDLLADGTTALVDQAQVARRQRLETFLGVKPSFPPRRKASEVLLTPQTDDPDEAETWFDPAADVEGVIAKRADLPYKPGDRAMVKVKKRRTADCVVGGYRLAKNEEGIGSLLLGLYDDSGVLHYVGHTSSFKAAERKRLLKELAPLKGPGFGAGRAPGGPSRWSGGRDPEWVSLHPRLVCEVTYDKLQGDRFRHAATFVRWRTDRDPRSCTFAQL